MPNVRAESFILRLSVTSFLSLCEIALLNVIETLLNIAYLYLAHIAQWPPATIIGFGAALMTLSKTVLYWAQEYYCGFCAIGHNTASDLFFLWIIPNGWVLSHNPFVPSSMCRLTQSIFSLWIVVPSFVVVQFGKDLAKSLNFAAQQSEKISSGKKN